MAGVPYASPESNETNGVWFVSLSLLYNQAMETFFLLAPWRTFVLK